MRKCLQYLLVAAFAELPLALPQGSQVPFSITISTAGNVFEAGSEVRIRLVVTNTSDREIPYTTSPGGGVDFTDVDVRDVEGKRPPETKYHRALLGRDSTHAQTSAPGEPAASRAPPGRPEPKPFRGGSIVGVILKPGQSREEEIVVRKLYNLSQPGQYSITASRPLSDVTTDPRSKLVAKSNKLIITIAK